LSAAWDVRTKLRRALIEFWTAQQSVTLLRMQSEAQETLVRMVEQEQAAGGLSSTEVARERIASSRPGFGIGCEIIASKPGYN